MVPEAAQGWGFGGTSSSGRGDADGAYAAREDASRGWYDRRNSGGDAAAARSKPLRPLSRQGATLLACLNVSPDLFDEAVEKQLDYLRQEAEQDQEQHVQQKQPQGAKPDAWSRDCNLLRERMAAVRAAERGRVAEDVLYTSILARMAEFDVRPTCGCEEGDLAWLHSPRAQGQLRALLDMQPAVATPLVAQHVRAATHGLPKFHRERPTLLPKLGVAQVYRRGILFGYALQQTMERHWLEGLYHMEDEAVAAELGVEPRAQAEEGAPTLVEFVDSVLDVREEVEKAADAADAAAAAQAAHVDGMRRNLAAAFDAAAADWGAEEEEQGQAEQETHEEDGLQRRDRADDVGAGGGATLEAGVCFATVEAMRVAERHATTMFGSILEMADGLRDVVGGADSLHDAQQRMEAAMRGGELETVALTMPAVCVLVLEGITFGKHLREAECNADLRFGLQSLQLI